MFRLGLTVSFPPAVPLDMKATPSSQEGSAGPSVSIVTTSSRTLLGWAPLPLPSPYTESLENHPFSPSLPMLSFRLQPRNLCAVMSEAP